MPATIYVVVYSVCEDYVDNGIWTVLNELATLDEQKAKDFIEQHGDTDDRGGIRCIEKFTDGVPHSEEVASTKNNNDEEGLKEIIRAIDDAPDDRLD